MKKLTADDILQSKDYELKTVEVEEWGGIVYLRPMNVRLREDIERMQKQDPPVPINHFVCHLVMVSLTDEDGSYLFEDCEESVTQLKQCNYDVIHKIFQEICELNGFNSNEQEVSESAEGNG